MDLREGTEQELNQLASLRGIGLPSCRASSAPRLTPGIDEAQRRGLLRFGEHGGRTCWAATDNTRKCTQVRRLDGGKLYAGPCEMKAKSLPGSVHSWPLGTELAMDKQFVAITEGGPDMIAAHQLAWGEGVLDSVAIVGMMGASCKIGDAPMIAFCDKRVRVFAHNDRAGLVAAKKWAFQLKELAKVDVYVLSGWTRRSDESKQISDLNDILVDISDAALKMYRNDPLFGFVE